MLFLPSTPNIPFRLFTMTQIQFSLCQASKFRVHSSLHHVFQLLSARNRRFLNVQFQYDLEFIRLSHPQFVRTFQDVMELRIIARRFLECCHLEEKLIFFSIWEFRMMLFRAEAIFASSTSLSFPHTDEDFIQLNHSTLLIAQASDKKIRNT